MRQEHWVPTRHQHLCSDHFEPSCFEYRWGVRYLRPDAVPTIFPGPGAPPKRPSPGKPPAAPQPEHPPPENRAAPAQPPDPDRAAPEVVTVPLRPASPAARPLRPLEPVAAVAPGVPEEPPAPSPAPRAPAERGGEAAAAVPPPVLAYVETVPAAAPEPLASPALPLP
uniref:THAP-type domain-containing protein n=1 Tax=Anser brachyrhynchus TaxID=132585 RepID=A0A8B9CJ24_9AVES